MPIVLELPLKLTDPSRATIMFSYSASDPAQVKQGKPAPGHLRIWTSDGATNRESTSVADEPVPIAIQRGLFVPSNRPIPAKNFRDFTPRNRTLTLYLEGIEASKEWSDQSITVTVSGPGIIESTDTVKVTVAKCKYMVYLVQPYTFSDGRRVHFTPREETPGQLMGDFRAALVQTSMVLGKQAFREWLGGGRKDSAPLGHVIVSLEYRGPKTSSLIPNLELESGIEWHGESSVETREIGQKELFEAIKSGNAWWHIQQGYHQFRDINGNLLINDKLPRSVPPRDFPKNYLQENIGEETYSFEKPPKRGLQIADSAQTPPEKWVRLTIHHGWTVPPDLLAKLVFHTRSQFAQPFKEGEGDKYIDYDRYGFDLGDTTGGCSAVAGIAMSKSGLKDQQQWLFSKISPVIPMNLRSLPQILDDTWWRGFVKTNTSILNQVWPDKLPPVDNARPNPYVYRKLSYYDTPRMSTWFRTNRGDTLVDPKTLSKE